MDAPLEEDANTDQAAPAEDASAMAPQPDDAVSASLGHSEIDILVARHMQHVVGDLEPTAVAPGTTPPSMHCASSEDPPHPPAEEPASARSSSTPPVPMPSAPHAPEPKAKAKARASASVVSRREKCEHVVELAGGKIFYWPRSSKFEAVCSNSAHGKRCVLTRTSQSGEPGTPQGRPSGLLAAWLHAGIECTTRADRWHPDMFKIDKATRIEWRDLLSVSDAGQSVLLKERQDLWANEPDFEPDEPM